MLFIEMRLLIKYQSSERNCKIFFTKLTLQRDGSCMKAFFRGDYVDKIIIGIDIGGTAVKIGILTREG